MADQFVTLGTTVKYNPHLWGKDELRAIFVARTRELAEIVHSITETPAGKVPQHLLITGARGMGKSTLLNRVALAIHEDAELARLWLPLVMPEEQYTISTLAELWLNVLGVLADSWEQQGANPIELAQLDLEVARIRTQESNEQESAALTLLTNVIKQNGKRLLLLIDSTDQLFGNLSTNQTKGLGVATGSTQLWRLRKTLSHCPELFWIGASYQALEVSQHYGDAFHDFFELIELRPLTLAEMRDAMLALARTFGISSHPAGNAAAEEMQRNLDVRPERLKTLRAITGGNPRTTVILYDLFAAGWKEDLHTDLKSLLDSMTPLYKARMENLAEQPRKILAHVMEQWSPVALGELAKVSGLASTTLSSQLKRLEQEGYIEKVKLPGTKRNGYQVSERLFNIWYLMRYTSRWVRQKLSWLIEFMRIWYSVDELRDFARARIQVHSQAGVQESSHLELSLAYAAAIPENCSERYQLEQRVFEDVYRLAKQQQQAINNIAPGLFDLDGNDHHFKSAEDYLLRFQALDEKLASCPHLQNEVDKQAWILAVKQNAFLSLPEKEQLAAVSITLEFTSYKNILKVLAKLKDCPPNEFLKVDNEKLLQLVAQGRYFPDCPDLELAYRQIISEFGSNERLAIMCMCILLVKQPTNGFEKVSHLLSRLFPGNAKLWFILAHVLKESPLHRYKDAEVAFRQAIKIDSKSIEYWLGLGDLLKNYLNSYEEAEVAYQQAQTIDPQNPYPCANRAHLAVQTGQTQHAFDLYRQTVKLATKQHELEGGIVCQELLLQANLWLNNRDAANSALENLAQAASSGDNLALLKLREQAGEAAAIGLGLALSELMAGSRYADFLQPMTLALRAAENLPDALEGVAAEFKAMATVVLADILAYRNGKRSD